MTPYYDKDGITIYCGDCREVCQMHKEQFTAIVTDPPYGLEFMGKDWDRLGKTDGFRRQQNDADIGRANVFGRTTSRSPEYVAGCQMQEWHQQWAATVLESCLPGAMLLAFGGTRTHHRLMCAVEDAGWEIRDTLMWVYGSGFPKSANISKMLDKREYTAPATEAAKLWDGYGTALKPAHEPVVYARKPLKDVLTDITTESDDGRILPNQEPIILAMKPCAGTFAENALTHGVAGLNIDGSRIECEGGSPAAQRRASARKSGNAPMQKHTLGVETAAEANQIGKIGRRGSAKVYMQDREAEQLGRWPANVIHDGSEEVVGHFPNATSGQANGDADVGEPGEATPLRRGNLIPRFDSGSAARFFYVAKASASERGKGNHHPTVKPVELMKYLLNLVRMPERNLILDPFMGSGTTLVAAKLLKIPCVGIEQNEAYCEIAVVRLKKIRQKTFDFTTEL